MQLTTKTIIKVLPLSDELKKTLLDNYDTLLPNQKFLVEDVAWNTYYALYKLRLQENMELALMRAQKNQEKLDDTFYQRVEQQTEKEMQSESLEKTETVDLSAARKAMEVIVKEIHAAKAAKKQ
ncbi:MAG: hypothetical protein HY429_02630 [Candidatus Levybacteria bacterium]|nr:hypothetical protein [Candidatus Levybacteria bacterium]